MIAALAVAVGGGLGAALRFVVDRFVTSHRRGSLPLGTVLVNVVGSFGLGVVSGLGILLGPEWILALGTGLFGGFTTFSTAMLDAVRLAREHRGAAAAAVVLGTLLWSLLAVAAGMTLAANWVS